MKGTKRERSPGHWQLRVYIGRTPDGHPIQRSRSFKGSARKADTALAQFVTEMQGARPAAGSFAELAEAWYEAKLPRIEATTARGYRTILDNRVLPALGHLRLDEVDTQAIESFYGTMSDLSPATVERHHAVVRGVLNAGVRWGRLKANPAPLTERPKAHKYQPTIPTPELARLLLDEADRRDPDLGTVLWVAASTGMRRGELAGLRWSHVDLDGGVITVRQAVAVVSGRTIVKSPKTHQRRLVELDPLTVEVLRRHRRRQEDRWPRLVADAFLFSRDHKANGAKPPNPEWMSKQWLEVRKKHNATDIRLHDLRHFVATMLIESGISVATVQKRLGHASPTTTLSIYSHALPGAGKQAAEHMGKVLGP